uniref:interleukin-3 receptor subunit alpha n=1 Tax=Ictidomys tridecemlineatus TaxID=43179 RepID=UPI001A9F2354|nr:interleukin-3 receptor subunit alpha [Ictidomys tridecemlineatus]
MDTARSRLTWDLGAPSSTIDCVTDSGHIQEAQDGTYCRYETLSLCTVTNYTVTVDQPPFATWILFPERDENPGTAPANLDCWVHDVDFMSCQWAVGRAAPGDVQYRLYWKDAREYRECGHYQTDSRGRHVGCRFSGISKYPRSFVVMVNGTSALSAIACRDSFADLYEIEFDRNISFSHLLSSWTFPSVERLSPPNITAKCNKTSSLMEWRTFSHFNNNFMYQLQVNKSSGGSSQETVSGPGPSSPRNWAVLIITDPWPPLDGLHAWAPQTPVKEKLAKFAFVPNQESGEGGHNSAVPGPLCSPQALGVDVGLFPLPLPSRRPRFPRTASCCPIPATTR